MEIGSIFLILALLLVVGLFVGRPLFDSKEERLIPASDSSDHQRSALLAERDRVLNALSELDFDYTLGKIPEEDYPPQRTVLLQKGAGLLRQLDALEPEAGPGEAEKRLEAALATRRMEAGATSMPSNGKAGAAVVTAALGAPEDEFEALLADRRRVRQEKATGFCPKCGQPVHKSDHFCPKCGAKTA
jgi:hypothetical protein